MGKNSKEREIGAKQEALNRIYRQNFLKQSALMDLKNKYICLGIAEIQIKKNSFFNEKDQIELVILRRHQLKMSIENTIFDMKNNPDYQVNDQELSDIKQEAINELRNPEKFIVFDMIE